MSRKNRDHNRTDSNFCWVNSVDAEICIRFHDVKPEAKDSYTSLIEAVSVDGCRREARVCSELRWNTHCTERSVVNSICVRHIEEVLRGLDKISCITSCYHVTGATVPRIHTRSGVLYNGLPVIDIIVQFRVEIYPQQPHDYAVNPAVKVTWSSIRDFRSTIVDFVSDGFDDYHDIISAARRSHPLDASLIG